MAINLVVAVTDGDWFRQLREQPNLREVNFWAPSAANFRALQDGEMFLFKLHAPSNAIAGGGVFACVTVTPDLHFEVSGRIREEFENGRHYYALHGQRMEPPARVEHHPDAEALAWHQENCFR